MTLRSVLAHTVAASVLVALASTAAHAQANFSAERFRPAADRDGILDVEWAGIEANPLEYDAGLLLGYAYDPLVLNLVQVNGQSSRVGALVQHRVGASVLGALTINRWLEIGGEMPLVLWQTSSGKIPGLTVPPLSPMATGDLRAFAKMQVLREDKELVDVAFIPALTVPTAFPQSSYSGEGFFTLVPEIAVSRTLPVGLRVAANAGVRLRPETDVFGLQVSQELTYRAGVGWRFLEDIPVELTASLNGATSLVKPFKHANTEPLEAIGGATWDVIPDKAQLYAGVGVGLIGGFGTPDARVLVGFRWSPRDHDRDHDGIKDDVDQCPDEAEDKDGFQDKDGCPDPDNDGDGIPDAQDECPNVKGTAEFHGCLGGHDRDGDGIPDDKDKCPDEPEDKDGFQDDDGCPDPDNDGDGIPDALDKCPNEPEDKDGYMDDDGCPDPDNDDDGILDADDKCPDQPGPKENGGCPTAKIVVTKKKVFTLQKIYFDSGKATIKQESLSVLDEVAKVLNDNPEIGRIRIEGHTDIIGGPEYNMGLSQARTESVRQYLTTKGKVPPERLEAVGYGLTRPIATNDTPEGREKNRRVEFVLIDAAQDSAKSGPPADEKKSEPAKDEKKPDAKKPDEKKPDAAKSDAKKPDAAKSDAKKADEKKADAPKQ